MPATTGRVVDAWAQPATGEGLARMPEIRRLFAQSGTLDLLEKRVGPEDMVALMDAAGVDHALLSAWCRPSGWVITNDEVAEYVSAFPDRFGGVAAVPLERPMDALKELRRAVQDLGFHALRVLPWLWNRPPSDALFYPLYAACVELGVPVCTQVGHTGPLMPSEWGRPVPYLDRVALDFPELVIVGGHIGHPWTDEMIGLAWKHANVHIDTSAYLPKYYPPLLVQFAATYGKDKVLFGTNFPQLRLDTAAQQARQLPMPAEALGAFLGGNARRVFNL